MHADDVLRTENVAVGISELRLPTRLWEPGDAGHLLALFLGGTMAPGRAFREQWDRLVKKSAEIYDHEAIEGELQNFARYLSEWLSAPEDILDQFKPLQLRVFVEPYVTFAGQATRKMRESAGFHGITFSEEAVGNLLLGLRSRLWKYASQTVILQLMIAKRRDEICAGDLDASKVEFTGLLLNKEFRLSLFQKFPILERVLLQVTMDSMAFWVEFTEHLCGDADRLRVQLGFDASTITGISPNVGDPHNCGRSVVILHNGDRKIVYKPRSLAVDRFYAETLAYLEEISDLPLKHASLIERDGYGWMEFVEHLGCDTPDTVRLVFKKLGYKVALLFILGCEDLHHENVIVRNDDAFFVDLEALFSAPLNFFERSDTDWAESFRRSPLSTLYFPAPAQCGTIYYDVSGGGFTAGQPIEYIGERHSSKDDDNGALFGLQRSMSEDSTNLPTVNGTPHRLLDYRDEFLSGFSNGLEDFIAFAASPKFVAWRARIGELRSRFIPRATASYEETLIKTLHPHAISKNAKDRIDVAATLIKDLWRAKAATELLPHDISSLQRGDVPLYTKMADSRAIWAPNGAKLDGMFSKSGAEMFDLRLADLRNGSSIREIDTVLLSFAARDVVLPGFGSGNAAAMDVPSPEFANAPFTSLCCDVDAGAEASGASALLVDAAIDIGDWVLRRAYSSGLRTSWTVRSGIHSCGLFASMSKVDLYAGVAGNLAFFSELYRVTRLDRFGEFARALFLAVNRGYSYDGLPIGAFNGLASVAFANSVYLKAFHEIDGDNVSHVFGRILEDEYQADFFDIISGWAGVLMTALGLAEQPISCHIDCAQLEDVIRLSKSRLLEAAIVGRDYVCWQEPSFPEPLIGMAHGACGISMALAKYSVARSDLEAREIALRGFRYAEALFDPVVSSWPDLRSAERRLGACAWCHGSAGIALARLKAQELGLFLVDAGIDRTIDTALRDVSRNGVSSNSGLCHGVVGNAAVLLRHPDYKEIGNSAVKTMARQWLSARELHGDIAIPTSELMDGVTGIGLQFLRCIDPTVCDVLTLETR